MLVFMITNDSGGAFFAARTDRPALLIFSPDTSTLYGSFGRQHQVILDRVSPPVKARQITGNRPEKIIIFYS
jgi:hypothetical protein